MAALFHAAREKEGTGARTGAPYPIQGGVPRLKRQLELNGAPCLSLHHDRTPLNLASLGHILSPQAHEVAGPQFGINSKVEQREIPGAMGEL